ncbi:hypothetical protein MMC25_005347 [Agyrium rufum]|nr:hypothetical protein [Agyrium rufum]
MSALDKELGSFRASMAASSSKLSNKRIINPIPKSTPSLAPSQSSITSKIDAKRKRPEPATIVYSQPADTGTGAALATQVTYAVEYLKQKGTAQSLTDLLNYLSLQRSEASYKRTLGAALRGHSKVNYDKDGNNGEGVYSFRPKHNIRSADELLAHLQRRKTFDGLPARELREGWADAEDAIMELEKQHRVLVTRNKKDNNARMVWLDDPTLYSEIDQEFKNIWHKVKLPDPSAIAEELEKNNMVPANKARKVVVKANAPAPKKKKPRKSGKTTNTHMLSVLRDYSHLKK